MPFGFFVFPYQRDADSPPGRSVPVPMLGPDDDWQEIEVGHPAITIANGDTAGRAIVAVRAPLATLSGLGTLPGVMRLPKDALDSSLSDLTNAQKTALRDKFNEFGYSAAEIQARFGNRIQDFILRDVVEFAVQRRYAPRYDAAQDRILCDTGVVQSCRALLDVERRLFTDARWSELKTIRDSLIAEWNANQQVIRLSQRLPGLPKWEREALLVLCGQSGYRFDRIRPDTFPTTGILDSFPDADGPLSANWTSPLITGDNACVVATNQIARNAAGASSSYWNASTPGPDTEVDALIGTKPEDTTNFGFFWRLVQIGSGTTDGYYMRNRALAGTDDILIRSITNEVFTSIGVAISDEMANGDSRGAEMIGSTITAYDKTGGSWASLGTRTDTTNTAAGNIGIGATSANWRGDDFGGGTVVTAGAVPAGFLRPTGVTY